MRQSAFRVSIRQHIRPAPFDGERIRRLVRKALAVLAPASADVRVLVVDDADMRKWNREFLGRTGTTNVISFPENDPESGAPGAIAGDILISAPTCLRQTKGWRGSPEVRVFYFVVHGMLHLAGYDHERGARDARIMRKREEEVYGAALGKDNG